MIYVVICSFYDLRGTCCVLVLRRRSLLLESAYLQQWMSLILFER